MTVIGIDPGPEHSAYVRWDGQAVLDHDIVPNSRLRAILRVGEPLGRVCVIEQIESYGMAVGADIFETVFQSGRIYAAAEATGRAERLTRRAVKLHLCGSSRAKDANIRQSLIDRFGGVGGKAAAIGRKASPGPLYGVRSHEWAALAVAVTWLDHQRARPCTGR